MESPRRQEARYGASIGSSSSPTGLIRWSAVALSGLFVASACSTSAGAELASLPERALAAAASIETDRATPRPARTPRPSKRPRPQATAAPDAERADGSPTVVRLKPRPGPGPVRMNLYRKGDFVHQATKDWCVAGSTQTMMNIMEPGKPNRSSRFQARLYKQGRKLTDFPAKRTAIGVDLSGWANLLNRHGYGPYVVDGRNTRKMAIRAAAKALRRTGKPVGLVTWRGAHSWVMSGFTATADPAYTNDFEVRKVFIQDVWYPYVSSIWGASRPPNAAVPVAALAEDYLPYRRPSHRWPKRDGRFMLILPTLPEGTVVR